MALRIKNILLLLLLVFVSCDKAYINGELDGLWRLESVEYASAVEYPSNIYYSFQRHMVQVSEHYEEELPDRYIGEFSHSDGCIYMTGFVKFPGVDAVSDPEDMKRFYIFNENETFYVDVLNEETLVMHTDERTYSFRKW